MACGASAGGPNSLYDFGLMADRLLRSGGDPAAVFPLFERSFDAAAAGEEFVAVDAAHMAAIVAEGDGIEALVREHYLLAKQLLEPS